MSTLTPFPPHPDEAKGQQAIPARVADAVERLIIVRESDVHAWQLMEAMVERTLRIHQEVPGADVALRAGLEPLRHPEQWDAATYRSRHDRAVVFLVDGTLLLYWMGSAALESREAAAEEDNEFCRHTAWLVSGYRPAEVRLADFSRLVRSERYSPQIRDACVDHAVKIHAHELVLDMASDTGRMMWTLQAMVSAAERNAIYSRLLLGQISNARNGGSPSGDHNVPPGYVSTGDSGRVHADATQQPTVEWMLRVLADPQLTARQKVGHLHELGISGSRLQARYGDDATVADAKHPHGIVKRLVGWAELYRTGQWRSPRRCPIRNIREFGGQPVYTDDDGQPWVDLVFDWGVPEGGWAPPEVLDAVVEQRERIAAIPSGRTGGAAHQTRKPLAGCARWRDGAVEHALVSSGRKGYVLKRRSLDSPDAYRIRRDWEHWQVGDTVGVAIDDATLHRSLADGIAEAVAGGVHVELIHGGALSWDDQQGGWIRGVVVDAATRRRQLHREIDQQHQQRSRLARLAGTAPSEELADEYHQQSAEVDQRLQTLRDELAACDRDDDQEVPGEVVVHAEYVLAALARLASLGASAPAEVGEALRTILDDLRFELDPHTVEQPQPQLRWHVNLLLPGEDGIVKLTGLTGTVPARRMRSRSPQGTTNDRVATAIRLLGEGATIAEINQRVGWHNPSTTRERLTDALPDLPRALRAALFHHPSREVRQHLWQLHTNPPPEGQRSGYQQRLAEVYLDPNRQADRCKAWRSAVTRQRILDALDERGGVATIGDLTPLVARRDAAWALRTLAKASDGWPAILSIDETAAGAGGGDRDARTVRLLACPQCGAGAAKAIRLPELTGVLCLHCRHSPHLPDIVFPEAYRTLQQAPTEAATETSPPTSAAAAPAPPPGRSQSRARALAALSGWPLHTTFTTNELAAAARCSENMARNLIQAGQRHGWITQASPHQHSSGTGMQATRYQLTASPPPATDPSVQPINEATTRRRVLAALPDEPFTARHLHHTVDAPEERINAVLRALRNDGSIQMLDEQTRGTRYQLTTHGHAQRAATPQDR